MSEQSFEMIAKTFQGLEEVLAQELTALGANEIEIGRRMVSFSGIALVEEGDIIKINIPEMTLNVDVSDEEMAARRAKWQPREPKVTTGYLKRYSALVTSGNRGAVLEVPEEK